jgi:hypothetical protein
VRSRILIPAAALEPQFDEPAAALGSLQLTATNTHFGAVDNKPPRSIRRSAATFTPRPVHIDYMSGNAGPGS